MNLAVIYHIPIQKSENIVVTCQACPGSQIKPGKKLKNTCLKFLALVSSYLLDRLAIAGDPIWLASDNILMLGFIQS